MIIHAAVTNIEVSVVLLSLSSPDESSFVSVFEYFYLVSVLCVIFTDDVPLMRELRNEAE